MDRPCHSFKAEPGVTIEGVNSDACIWVNLGNHVDASLKNPRKSSILFPLFQLHKESVQTRSVSVMFYAEIEKGLSAHPDYLYYFVSFPQPHGLIG